MPHGRWPYNSALQPTAAPLPSTISQAAVVALAAAERPGRWADQNERSCKPTHRS